MGGDLLTLHIVYDEGFPVSHVISPSLRAEALDKRERSVCVAAKLRNVPGLSHPRVSFPSDRGMIRKQKHGFGQREGGVLQSLKFKIKFPVQDIWPILDHYSFLFIKRSR